MPRPRPDYEGAAAVEGFEASDPQTMWRQGLGWLREDSQKRFRKSFPDLSQHQQLQVLIAASRRPTEGAREDPGERLIAMLKSQVIQCYYTSRRGLDELDHEGNTYHVECPGSATHGDS